MPDAARDTRDRALSAAMQEIADLLLSTDTFQDVMQQIADLAAQTIPGVVTAGITVGHGGRVITVAASGRLGAQLDQHQYDLDDGPCLESLRTGLIVSAPELAVEDRWGGYPRMAMAHGVSSIHASPLKTRGGTVGVLNLYADHPRAFDTDDQVTLIAQVATFGAVAIAGTLRSSGDVQLTQQLQSALQSRSVIDQAVGIVIATQRCTPDQAFVVLRGISQTRNLRLARIAQDLVSRTSAPDTADRPRR